MWNTCQFSQNRLIFDWVMIEKQSNLGKILCYGKYLDFLLFFGHNSVKNQPILKILANFQHFGQWYNFFYFINFLSLLLQKMPFYQLLKISSWFYFLNSWFSLGFQWSILLWYWYLLNIFFFLNGAWGTQWRET